MIKMKQSEGFLDKYWAICIVTIPIISMYTLGISTITVSEWIMLVGAGAFLLYSKGKVWVDDNIKPFLWFIIVVFAFTMLSQSIQMGFESIVIIRNIRLIMYVVFILVAYNIVETTTLLKVLRVISVVAAVYVLLQFVFYKVLGIYLPSHILPLPTSREENIEVITDMYNRYYFRAYGFFAEPSNVGKFLLPGLAYSLYGWGKDYNKIDYKMTSLIVAAIICSTSMQGIICMVILLAYRFITALKGRYLSKRSLFGGILLSAIMVILFFFFSRQQGFEQVISRFLNLKNGTYIVGGSFSLRLFRGYLVFWQLPFLFKVFGIGYGGLTEYIITNQITTKHDSYYSSFTASGYVNGISLVLCSVGIIGFIVFCWFIIRLFQRINPINKLILIAYVLLLLSGGGIFDHLMVFYLSILFVGEKVLAERNED